MLKKKSDLARFAGEAHGSLPAALTGCGTYLGTQQGSVFSRDEEISE